MRSAWQATSTASSRVHSSTAEKRRPGSISGERLQARNVSRAAVNSASLAQRADDGSSCSMASNKGRRGIRGEKRGR